MLKREEEENLKSNLYSPRMPFLLVDADSQRQSGRVIKSLGAERDEAAHGVHHSWLAILHRMDFLHP